MLIKGDIMKTQSIAILLALLLTTFSGVLAQPVYQGQVSFVPPGTPVSVTMAQTLSSEFTRVGETFTANLASPIYAGSEMIAGPGSQVQGQVVAVEPAGRGGKPGSMDLRLVSIITPEGRRIPLSATVDQNSFQLEADGGRTSHLVKTTAIGAGSGALGGLVMNAVGGGKKGKGTAIGTGIGAGVGLLGGAIQKGKDFVLTSGSIVPFRLDQAIQAQASAPVQQYGSEYGGGYGGGFQAPAGYGSAPYSGGYQQQAPNPYLGN